jgi:hypothetical protein
MTTDLIDPATCRKARAALQWSPWTLARAAGLAEGYVLDFEAGIGRLRPGMLTALRRVLIEGAGRLDGELPR